MNKNKHLVVRDIFKTIFLLLWGMMFVHLTSYGTTTDKLISEMIINTDVYVQKSTQSGSQTDNILKMAVTKIQNFMFPGTAYAYQEMTENNEQTYHPTEKEMEAMAEENSQYEALEREAKKRLAMNESGLAEDETENNVIPNASPEGEDAVSANVNVSANTNQNTNSDTNINTNPAGIVYDRASLLNFQFLMNQFYVIDSSTACDESVFSPQVLLDKDLTMDVTGDEPKILIYHTHSQEAFADSVAGDVYGTVVGLGNTLTDILQNQYGISVYHDVGTYDVINGQIDRSEAYAMALPVVEDILAAYPSIKVVIDLHRDGVNENTHLVTTVNGKPTAKIMFFNGLCRNTAGTEGYMQNPYLEDNLAFSLKMQLKAAEMYPDFTRRIYLRSYRFNMHVAPRMLLIECGAQTNTVEEVQNAMAPLADILYSVLTGT